ncbi:MAG: protease modulator HflK [Kiritimatiellae bacterium]|nr:protease modulator HflK [Kiritimatiellia bacterium]
MDKRNEKIALLTGLTALGCLCVNALLWRRTQLLTVQALLPHFVGAVVVSLFAALRARMRRLAQEEARDEELARKEQKERTLFAAGPGEDVPLAIAYSRRQMERFVVPVVAPVLAAAQAALAWWLYGALRAPAPDPAQHQLAAALLGGQAFVLFVLSRYGLNMARLPARESRLLRAPAALAGLCGLLCFAAAAVALLAERAYPPIDRIAGLALAGLLGAMAVENLLAFVWTFYRPRRAKGMHPSSCESGIARLLVDPSSWTKTAAETLDYQFGFKISETWFYRFLASALVPLIIFQLVALYLLSCFVLLGPDEEAILERFGRPVENGWHLTSGAHLKLPWPFETVRRFPTKRIQRLYVGFEWDEQMPEVLVWTIPHFKREDRFLVASREDKTLRFLSGADTTEEEAVPVSLLNVNVPVEYVVTNIYAFAYNYSNPQRVLADVATRSVSLEAVGKDLFDVMGPGQMETSHALQAAIQAEADRLKLGIRVLFVGMQGVHPPVQVADAFESVVGALEEKEALVLEAHTYARRTLPAAEAASKATVAAAEGYRKERVTVSAAEADRFLKQLESFARSPTVFRMRTYLQALQETLTGVRKFIMTVKPTSEVIQLRFDETETLDLFDTGVKAPPIFDTGPD